MIKDKFVLIEFSSVKDQKKLSKYYENINLKDDGLVLQKIGLLEFYNYFYDHQCGYIMIKLKNGYMIQLYDDLFEHDFYTLGVLSNPSKYVNMMKNLIKRSIDDEFLIIDPENLYTHLFLDCLIIPKIENISTLNLLKTQSSNTLSINIFLPHNKFTKEECIYWANYHLQTFIQFNKIIYLFKYRSIDFDTPDEWLNVLKFIMKKALKIAKGNNSNITFLIDGCMEFNKKKDEVKNELYKLIIQNRK